LGVEDDIKRRLLDMLEKDPEFRYAVAGILGMSQTGDQLSGISKSIEKLSENQEKLWLEVKSLRENQEKLWLEVKSLRENQEKLWLEVKSLRENQEKLWLEVKSLRENQEKLWLEVKSLRENQEKLWLEVKSLRENQEKAERDIRDIKTTLQRLTLSEEEEAGEVLAAKLEEKLGVRPVFTRLFIDSKEVDLYSAFDDYWLVCEATVRFGSSMIDELNQKVELIKRSRPDLVRPKLIKAVYTIISVGDAAKKAEEQNIWVLTWKEELTPLKPTT